MDLFRGIDLKKYFKIEKIQHDNWLFKLHHQVNFVVLLFGVVFTFGNNYLNGNAIVCLGSDDYAKQYCWLHGSGHLTTDIAEDISGLCGMETDKDRETSYYLWLPFVLGLCMGLVKVPRVLWKTLCERGTMAGLVGDENDGGEVIRNTGEKIAERFKKLRRRNMIVKYHIRFACCEILNIFMLMMCFFIMNSLLNGKFFSYGKDVTTYYQDLKTPNPMCNVFPTEVACNYCTGSIGGGCNDKHSHLCILSNNLFNQYFFLILWFCWVSLLTISALGLVYRAAQMSIVSFSKIVLKGYLNTFGFDDAVDDLTLGSSDLFLLGKLAMNVKGSTMQDVLRELRDSATRTTTSKEERMSLVEIVQDE